MFIYSVVNFYQYGFINSCFNLCPLLFLCPLFLPHPPLTVFLFLAFLLSFLLKKPLILWNFFPLDLAERVPVGSVSTLLHSLVN